MAAGVGSTPFATEAGAVYAWSASVYTADASYQASAGAGAGAGASAIVSLAPLSCTPLLHSVFPRLRACQVEMWRSGGCWLAPRRAATATTQPMLLTLARLARCSFGLSAC